MSEPIHPSIETLSAYFDNELPESERAAIEAYLASHPEAQTLLSDFSLLNEAGPAIDDRLPGDGYWMDLPDRILARIAAEDAAPVSAAVTTSQPSLWQRLFPRQCAWRFAVGSGAALALVATALWVLQEPENPVNPVMADVNPVLNAPTPGPMDVVDQLVSAGAPDPDAETYARRVVRTLGGPSFGESLNPGIQELPQGGASSGPGALRTVGLGHSNALPPLQPEAAREMENIICNGPGESSVESAMLLSVKADEMGQVGLARDGYQVVMQNTPANDPLHWEARYRLTYSLWTEHMASLDEMGRARAMAELNTLAQKTYQAWIQSGQLRDCQRAYCLNRTLKTVSREMAAQEATAQTAVRVDELAACVRGQN